jgi:hypothetical protein
MELLTRDGGERYLVDRQRRFAGRAPHALIRIGEQRVDDLAISRATVAAVLIGQLRSAELELGHNRLRAPVFGLQGPSRWGFPKPDAEVQRLHGAFQKPEV